MAQSKKQGRSRNKLSRDQREARVHAAEERERRAQEQREKSARTKRIFTIVVCAILVLALCIPTMALSVLSF